MRTVHLNLIQLIGTSSPDLLTSLILSTILLRPLKTQELWEECTIAPFPILNYGRGS